MSFFHAAPEALRTAASNVAGIGTEISSANAAASLPTTGVVAAAADQVSAQVAALFSSHAEGYQQLSSQMAAFHDKFVQALGASADSYATAEQSAARALTNAAGTPAQQLLGGQSLAGPAAEQIAGSAAKAAGQAQSALQGAGGSALRALGLTPTGGPGGLAAPRGLLGSAQAAPAAVIPVSWAESIQAAYLAYEPYVAYGFELASYAVGWLPYVGILAPQVLFVYNLFEPIVQATVFNTTDWLAGVVSFSEGLNNIAGATTASINQFISTEYYWFLSFLPPLPPLPGQIQ